MGAPEVVVLDTNVLVSALGWKGPEHRIYLACREGDLLMATSHALLVELGRVLLYPKFGFAEQVEVSKIVVVTDWLAWLREQGLMGR